jgi:hypothetical protein
MKKVLVSVVVVAVIVIGLFLLWASQGVTTTPEGSPSEACVDLCKTRLTQGVDLSNGPCLSNTDPYVCDVAHNPRQDVDNDPANQCSEYGKAAGHFVEVDPQCNIIKQV